MHLQRELRFRLDELDKNIELYRVEKVMLMRDKYIKDHDEGKILHQSSNAEDRAHEKLVSLIVVVFTLNTNESI